MIKLTSPQDFAKICLQTPEQKEFLANEEYRAKMDGNKTLQWYNLERIGEDFSAPLPVSFSWEDDEDKGDASYYLLVSERSDMKDAWFYITDDLSYDVYNLKVATKYYWCVQKNTKRSRIGSFETELTLPRTLKTDNVYNVRDMGGYKVEKGYIRQGLVYRGGELEIHMNLLKQGAEEFLRMGIRTELDMRGEAAGVVDATAAEALNIKRVFIPCSPYADVFLEESKNSVKNFFKVFTSPKNYPIYYHCWGGADRTGTFAFILGAFLGMKLEDLINEYEFTTLAIWGIRTRNYKDFAKFLELFNAVPGETLKEKAETYLKEFAGLTDKQLNSIYEIMVQEVDTDLQ